MLGLEPRRQYHRWPQENWLQGGGRGARLDTSLQQGPGNMNIKRLLLIKRKLNLSHEEIQQSSVYGKMQVSRFAEIVSFICICLSEASPFFIVHKLSSVDQSYPTLWHHGLRHTRLPCPSLSPRVCSNSCPLSRWFHSTVSSSVVPFSSCLQSFPASGSFPVSCFLASSGQRIGVSASASALPVNTQDWSPLGWTGWISLQSKGLSRVFSSTTVQSINSSVLSFLCSPTLTSVHDYWKNQSFD